MCGYYLRLSRNKVTVRERAVEMMNIKFFKNLVFNFNIKKKEKVSC